MSPFFESSSGAASTTASSRSRNILFRTSATWGSASGAKSRRLPRSPCRIDHYIKDVLGMKYYARYMDDGCIISESKEKLEICLRELRRLCAEHGIRLNPKKTQIIKLTRGFTFVKVRFRYGANGKVVRRATYKGIRHMRKKLRIFRRWVDSGRMTAADVETSLVSWRGHMKRFHSYHMEQSVERLYRELFKGG